MSKVKAKVKPLTIALLIDTVTHHHQLLSLTAHAPCGRPCTPIINESMGRPWTPVYYAINLGLHGQAIHYSTGQQEWLDAMTTVVNRPKFTLRDSNEHVFALKCEFARTPRRTPSALHADSSCINTQSVCIREL